MASSGFNKGDFVKMSSASRVHAWRPVTSEDLEAWEADPYNKTIGEDGETRLPPRSTYVSLVQDRIYIVQHGRVAARRSYYTISGCCSIVDSVTGETLFVERKDVVRV